MLDNEFVYRIAYIISREGLGVSSDVANDRRGDWPLSLIIFYTYGINLLFIIGKNPEQSINK